MCSGRRRDGRGCRWQEEMAQLIRSITASEEHRQAVSKWRGKHRPVKQYPSGLPEDRDAALCQAAVFGDCHRIKELCDAGANPNCQKPSQTDLKGPDTCLARIAAMGSGRAATLLVQYFGARPELHGATSGQSPIHFAAKFGHGACCSQLAEAATRAVADAGKSCEGVWCWVFGTPSRVRGVLAAASAVACCLRFLRFPTPPPCLFPSLPLRSQRGEALDSLRSEP